MKRDGKEFGPKAIMGRKVVGNSSGPKILDPTHHSEVVSKENKNPNDEGFKAASQVSDLGISNLVPLEQTKKVSSTKVAATVDSSHAYKMGVEPTVPLDFAIKGLVHRLESGDSAQFGRSILWQDDLDDQKDMGEQEDSDEMDGLSD